jgi:shikimate kinase
MTHDKLNIVLVGMAGCGKSSVGKMLARKMHMSFVDTDDLIVEKQGRPLQQIIDSEGSINFKRIEEEVLLDVNVRNYIIATGGSSIYSSRGIEHLKKNGVIVLLQTNLDILKKRVGDTSGRGLVKSTGQSFEGLYEERRLLYERSADITIECSCLSLEEVCNAIVEQLKFS